MTKDEAKELFNKCDNNFAIDKIYQYFKLDEDCTKCKYYLSENGNFPLEPCGECRLFYSNKWESKV